MEEDDLGCGFHAAYGDGLQVFISTLLHFNSDWPPMTFAASMLLCIRADIRMPELITVSRLGCKYSLPFQTLATEY